MFIYSFLEIWTDMAKWKKLACGFKEIYLTSTISKENTHQLFISSCS